uniref:Uncharacterized protein n=1 Tax=Rhizobium rhizogenes TaxID=359 RepID=A0A7S4ZS39_RHIRH|nr:hypothetical protein pC5.8d_692 [Rhizobium rhizogenes]
MISQQSRTPAARIGWMLYARAKYPIGLPDEFHGILLL